MKASSSVPFHTQWLLWGVLWAKHRGPGDHGAPHSSSACFIHSPSPGVLQQVLVGTHSVWTRLVHLLRRVLLAEKTLAGCLFQSVFGSEKEKIKGTSSRGLAAVGTMAQTQGRHDQLLSQTAVSECQCGASAGVRNRSPKMALWGVQFILS